MGTRGYGYNQIRVRIHIITGSQILVYYNRGYSFRYQSRARDGFYLRVPVDMSIFATPKLNRVSDQRIDLVIVIKCLKI